MTSDHSASSNNSLESHLMAKSSKCLSHCSSCAKHGDSASVPATRVMWTYKGEMNSTSRENWKKQSILTDVSFNGYSNEETLNINKTCWQ